MRIITKVIGVMAVCFLLLTVSFSIYFYNKSEDIIKPDLPYLEFSVDKSTHSITVTGVENLDFSWNDISVVQGNALLPKGPININDTITNCYGAVKLKLPYNYGYLTDEEWIFSDRTLEPFEDIRFMGSWEGDGLMLNFNADGTYSNYGMSFDYDEPPIYEEQTGQYTQQNLLILQQEVNNTEPLICDFSFSDDDTVMDLYCYNQRSKFEFKRVFSDELYITILNASQKLDDCLSFFISNYSNETHKDILSSGLNVTVVFTNELIELDIHNLSNKNIFFNKDSNGNITHDGVNYSIRVNSLHDLYNLVYRVDVILIVADDEKFGC